MVNRSLLKSTSRLLALTLIITSHAHANILANSVDLFSQADQDTEFKSPAQVHEDNLAIYTSFVDAENADTDDDYLRPKSLRPSYANEALQSASSNPVVALHETGKYDPKSKGIGYCFGRAMFIHLELAYRGLDRDSIRKAFVVGPMQTPDGASWGWHVTTIVQSKDSRGNEIWLAIDPIAGVVDVRTWYAKMRDSYSTDKKLKLYITLPTRFAPSPHSYQEEMMRNEYYNNYFTDMLAWFEKQSTEGRYDKAQYGEF